MAVVLSYWLPAFARDDREQDSSNLFQSVKPVANQFVAEYWSRAFIPAHAFASLPKGILKPERTILPRAARVSLADVRMDADDRSVELRRDFLHHNFSSESLRVIERIRNESF